MRSKSTRDSCVKEMRWGGVGRRGDPSENEVGVTSRQPAAVHVCLEPPREHITGVPPSMKDEMGAKRRLKEAIVVGVKEAKKKHLFVREKKFHEKLRKSIQCWRPVCNISGHPTPLET